MKQFQNWIVIRQYACILSGILLLGTCTMISASDGTGDYIHYRLGVKYKNDKKYEQAINEFKKVLAAYPDNYNAYFHMAEIRQDQKQPRLVIFNLKKALTYNPGWSRAQKMLAAAYEKDGQYQKAILELQQYQQAADPAERDSIQNQIDRLISVVSKKGGSAEPEKNDTLKTADVQTEKGTSESAEIDKKAGTAGSKESSVKSEKGQNAAPGHTAEKPLASSPDAMDKFTKAVDLYNQEKFDDAMKLLREVLTLEPKNAGAFYYAGLIRYRQKQNRMAVINLQKGTSYPELGHNAHYYLGKIYGEDKQYARAITHLFKYIEKSTYEPGKKEAQQLIEEYRKLGGAAVLDAIAPGLSQPVSADSAAEGTVVSAAADTVSPREQYITLEVRIDSLLTMVTVDTIADAGRKMLGGIHAFTEGAYDKAIQEFKKVLSDNPSGTIAVQCLYNTGICYLKMRLLKEADNQFQQVLERSPNHALASNSLFLKALTYLERSEPVTAEKLLRTFIQNHRKHPWISNAYEKLGDAYCDMEQQKKAIDAYSQAVTLTQKSTDKVAMLFKLGKAYLETGNSSRGIEALDRAIEAGEKANVFLRVPDSYYRIADEFYKAKEYDKSLDYYTRVTRKYPSFQETPWGLFQIGSVNKNLKNYQAAIDVFKDLIRRFPDDYWARQAQWKMEDAIWEHEYKAVLK